MTARVKEALKKRAATDADEHDGEIRLGILDEVVGYNLRMAQEASFRAFARHVGQPQVKPGWFAAMTVIHNNPGLTQMDLGRAIARDKSSVTPLIQALQKKKLVSRRQSKIDRRRVTLRLTKAGEAVLEKLTGHALDHDNRLDAIVGTHKATFIALLKKIADEIA